MGSSLRDKWRDSHKGAKSTLNRPARAGYQQLERDTKLREQRQHELALVKAGQRGQIKTAEIGARSAKDVAGIRQQGQAETAKIGAKGALDIANVNAGVSRDNATMGARNDLLETVFKQIGVLTAGQSDKWGKQTVAPMAFQSAFQQVMGSLPGNVAGTLGKPPGGYAGIPAPTKENPNRMRWPSQVIENNR